MCRREGGNSGGRGVAGGRITALERETVPCLREGNLKGAVVDLKLEKEEELRPNWVT